MTGFEAQRRQMERLRETMVKEHAQKAVLAGAKVIAGAMAERAPVQDERSGPNSSSLPVGALKADIKAHVPRKRDVQSEVVATYGPGRKTGYVARWVEYGHRVVKGGYSKVLPDGKTRGPGKASSVDVPAKPFLRPAYMQSEQEAIEARDAVLREGWSGK